VGLGRLTAACDLRRSGWHPHVPGRALGAGLAALLALAALALPAPALADPLADAVFEGIAERLSLMKSVAAWKRASGVAIEDRAREGVVLENAVGAAAAAGLDPAMARPFFEAQIAAAKDVQNCWIGRWDANEAPPPEGAPDLKTEIRPALLELDRALLASIEAALARDIAFDQARAADFAAVADVECLSAARRAAVYRRLGQLRLAE
jgi:chorismate mutase-like protein